MVIFPGELTWHLSTSIRFACDHYGGRPLRRATAGDHKGRPYGVRQDEIEKGCHYISNGFDSLIIVTLFSDTPGLTHKR
ncbi:MAG TPA: hypothetical protein VJ761_24730 [Ktedonobacteraceae bacterium]|nr:hypothetical protein [Ktedonobacteraceae bacterium]